MESRIDNRKFKRIKRRELLKLAPVLAIGAFAIPKFQEPLLRTGLGFSDWVSARLFRSGHLATTFPDSEVAPFEKFPINGYDVEDPGVDLDKWTLTVSGAVQKPGDYTLAQFQSLPRVRQNTRHVCVEGWDVIGRFGGARLSDFLHMIGADTTARFISVECADDYYESLDMATALHPANPALLRDVRPAADARARRSAAPADSHESRIQAGQVFDRFESHECIGQGRLLGRSGLFFVLWTVAP